MTFNANTLRVKTKEGKTVGILITPNTSYRSKGTATSSADLKIGDRVVVELTLDGIVTSEGGEVGTAQDIRFAPDERK
jgi:sporulation protein YlmC with PRC-barrel domain